VFNGDGGAQALRIFGNVFFDPIEGSGSQRPQKIDTAEAAFAFDGKIASCFTGG